MNLNQYLRSRHKTVNALTRPEAEILYLDYPLVRGWVDKYGCLEIPDEIVLKLRESRAARYAKVASNKAKSHKRRSAPNTLKMTKSQRKGVV